MIFMRGQARDRDGGDFRLLLLLLERPDLPIGLYAQPRYVPGQSRNADVPECSARCGRLPADDGGGGDVPGAVRLGLCRSQRLFIQGVVITGVEK